MTNYVSELNALQKDVLKEIGNIGSGNAATALAQLINKRIDMSVPQISVLPLQEVPDAVGGAEILVVGVFLRVAGITPCNILFIFPIQSARDLVDMLMGRPVGTTEEFTELDFSALKELGNIVSGAYLNALTMFTKLPFTPSVPALAVDMAGAILSTVLIELGEVEDHTLVIETNFKEADREIKGHLFLLPDPGSLGAIMEALGVN